MRPGSPSEPIDAASWSTPGASPGREPLRGDERAQARFQWFLLTAVGTVITVRTLLAATGYPQVGGRGLHVAHVLWGGLLMAAAIVLLQVVPGNRARRRAAFVGGVGFGLFIDEVGKFVTADVDYFFRPAVPMIYATFVVLQLGVTALVRRWPLDDDRRLAIAANAVTDLALGQLDAPTRRQALEMLAGIDEHGPLAPLAASVRGALTSPAPSAVRTGGWLDAAADRARARVERVMASRAAIRLVAALVGFQLVHVLVGMAIALATDDRTSVGRVLLDTGVSTLVGVALLATGAVCWRRGNVPGALRAVEAAVLIQLLYTQLFIFERQQLAGIFGFVAGLFVLGTVRTARAARAGERPPRPQRGESLGGSLVT